MAVLFVLSVYANRDLSIRQGDLKQFHKAHGVKTRITVNTITEVIIPRIENHTTGFNQVAANSYAHSLASILILLYVTYGSNFMLTEWSWFYG